ncbi:hypothetical protein RIF29_06245 [Crotalaria pallida]|uniref:SMP-LTD domain-containing protein n=1 Tax=Crotalaria pallida TaxID=3830 RepID=A0AAN9J4H3_CROPI
MVLVFVLILLGFFLGVVAVVAAEAYGVLWILKRLRIKSDRDKAKISEKTKLDSATDDPHQSSLNFAFKKEGVVWVLEPDKVSKFWQEKPSREQKRKKELLEVSPVRKYGKIKDQTLTLTEPDALQATIQLNSCVVEAVSATSLSTKKWSKKYPIKVESKTSVIYHGSKTLYIYLETSSQKEAWCRALRLASCEQKEKLEWFSQLHEEFRSYLASLNTEYHYFMKPSIGFSVEPVERASKPDGSSSKVRQFWKKFTKKSSRANLDNKSAWTPTSGHEEKKSIERLRACQDAVLATSFMKSASTSNHLKSSMIDNSPPLSHSGSQSHISVSSDFDADERFGIDEGTLCWNLLLSRLFFDVKSNAQMKRSIQEKIQRTLSNMRTPSYVGEVICTDINTGNIPPCIIAMRVLPMEMSEVCALEVDFEYSGGALLEIETRLEVGELELQKGTGGSNPELSNVGAVPSDLLEGFEYFGKELNISEGMNDLQEPKEEGDWNTDVSKTSRSSSTSSSTHGSKWKSILNSVAKQFSQVPLSLAIRVASLRGTLRLHIKPPPSDQLWYGFTFMPDIDFNLDSSVGEHKITNSHIAQFIVNRLKVVIRDTLVLPNCESIYIPWMLAEKDDWVPRKVAPFIWIKHESGNEPSTSVDTDSQLSVGVKAMSEACSSTSSDVQENKPPKPKRADACSRTSSDVQENKPQKPKRAESCREPARKSDSLALPLSSSSSMTLRNSKSLDELTTPLLENDRRQEDLKELRTPSLRSDTTHEDSEEKVEDISDCQLPPTSAVLHKQNSSVEQDNSKPKKIGRREKMQDLRKRMSEKFEEKKRHIEEKVETLLRK